MSLPNKFSNSIFAYNKLRIDLEVIHEGLYRDRNGTKNKDYETRNFDYSTFLVFKYIGTKTSSYKSVFFSFPHMHNLKSKFKKFAETLVERQNEIYIIPDDDSEPHIAEKYARYGIKIEAKNSIVLMPAIFFDDNDCYKYGVVIKIGDPEYSINIPFDMFLAITDIVENFNLFLSGQLLVNAALTTQYYVGNRKTVSMADDVVEV